MLKIRVHAPPKVDGPLQEPQVGEDPLDHGGLGDEGDHAAPPSAVLADEDVDLEH